MAGDEKTPSSPAVPDGKASSTTPPESQLIPEQDFKTIKNLDEIEKWHKEHRRQVEKISDAVRQELKEAREQLQKEENGSDKEEVYRQKEEVDDEAPPPLRDSMGCFRSQMDIRKQKADVMRLLLQRQSEYLDVAAKLGDGGVRVSGEVKKRVENAKQIGSEAVLYLPILLRAMERRLILRVEVEKIEPPVYDGQEIEQSVDDAPAESDEETESDVEIAADGLNSSTMTVQETEDFATFYETSFSFLSGQNRRTVENLEVLQDWYTKERNRVAGLQTSLFREIQNAYDPNQLQQEGGGAEEDQPQEQGLRGEQDIEKCLEMIKGQQQFLQEKWSQIYDLLRQHSETEALIDEIILEQKIIPPAERAGAEHAAYARRWMGEQASYFQLLILAMVRRCLVKAELELLESPEDGDGATTQDGSGRRKKGRRR